MGCEINSLEEEDKEQCADVHSRRGYMKPKGKVA